MIEVRIDGVALDGAARAPRSSTRARRPGVVDPHAVLRRHDRCPQRVPGLRRRGHRQSHPRARMLAGGRAREWRSRPTARGCATPGAWCSSCSAAASTCRSPIASRSGTPRYGADPDRFGDEAETRRAAGEGRQRPATSATTRSASSATSASTRAATRCSTRSRSPSPDRGFGSTVSTEHDVTLPESACVYCGNCIEVCPDRRAHVQVGARHAGGRDLGRGAPDHDRHDLRLLRRGLHAVAARAARRGRRSRRPDRQGDVTPRQQRHRRATSASRAASAPTTSARDLRLRTRRRRRRCTGC